MTTIMEIVEREIAIIPCDRNDELGIWCVPVAEDGLIAIHDRGCRKAHVEQFRAVGLAVAEAVAHLVGGR